MRTLAWILLVSASAAAQPVPDAAAIDKVFAGFNTHTPGCAVAAARNGKTVFQAGYGMADLERNVPITPDTVFESGSVAKQFTAATLMLLAQQGKLSLDDEMRKHLPELSSYGAPVTIRQVISHLSGLREWRLIAALSGMPEGTLVLTNQDLLRHATRQRALNFDPGSHYSYSNTGYNISTILIERLTGKPFPQVTQDLIFGPLEMTHSRWRDDFRAIIPRRALAYGRDGGGWKQQTPIENIIGAGGLLTTVGDLLLWNENFTHARVGGPDFVKAQQTPAILTSGKAITYAAGLQVRTYGAAGHREVAHSGATGGYRTWLARYPDAQLSLAVLCNAANAVPTQLGQQVAEILMGTDVDDPPMAVPLIAVPPEALQALAGLYRRVRDNAAVELQVKDGKLMFEDAALTPFGGNHFVHLPSRNRFVFDANGFAVQTPLGDTRYDKAAAAQPTRAELAALAGVYSSSEINNTPVRVESGSTGLILRIGETGKPVALKPTFRDGFEAPLGSFYFERDNNGKPTALVIGDGRAWGIRLTPVR
jgi:CubicO group peptidase (beta-lactamase class C family)